MTATRMPSAQASPRHVTQRPDDIHDTLRRRSLAVHARIGVAEAIRALALDICGGEEALGRADRAWLRQHIAAPVNEATEEALRVLVDELGAALSSVPPRLRPSLVAPLVSRTDFE